MHTNPPVLKAYIYHFLPREAVDPVSIVLSLGGVIDAISDLSVPDEYAKVGKALVFTFSTAEYGEYTQQGNGDVSLFEDPNCADRIV